MLIKQVVALHPMKPLVKLSSFIFEGLHLIPLSAFVYELEYAYMFLSCDFSDHLWFELGLYYGVMLRAFIYIYIYIKTY